MCGRFTLFAEFNKIIDRFEIGKAISMEQYTKSYNIAPSHHVLAVINDGQRNRLGFLKWGLVPSWAKDEKIGYKMINARAETLAAKPSFRQAYMKRRCLVIADSFYEWIRHEDKTKTPMRIKLKSNDLFAMAGLWEKWQSASGEVIFSCTVVTTTPNKLMKSIHDRMPVILKPDDEKTWLDPSIKDPYILNNLLKPLPEEWMDAHQVTSLVNSPKNNAPNLIEEGC